MTGKENKSDLLGIELPTSKKTQKSLKECYKIQIFNNIISIISNIFSKITSHLKRNVTHNQGEKNQLIETKLG